MEEAPTNDEVPARDEALDADSDDGDIFADAEEVMYPQAEKEESKAQAQAGVFHPPPNLALPTRSFDIPSNFRNAPPYNLRRRPKGQPDGQYD